MADAFEVLRQSARHLNREGFRVVHRLATPEAAEIVPSRSSPTAAWPGRSTGSVAPVRPADLIMA
jgi:hypothetical protein